MFIKYFQTFIHYISITNNFFSNIYTGIFETCPSIQKFQRVHNGRILHIDQFKNIVIQYTFD